MQKGHPAGESAKYGLFLSLLALASLLVGCLHENVPPQARILGSYSAEDPLIVEFDGARSKDEDGRIKEYHWDFGDGTKDEGERVTHTYQQPGQYTVILTVTDDRGLKDQTSITIALDPKVKEAFFDSESPAEIRLIGERHKNVEIQKWLAQTLAGQTDLDLLALEIMPPGPIDVSYYCELAHRDPRVAELLREIAWAFLVRNLIDGTEYYAILTALATNNCKKLRAETPFIGVEDLSLVKQHINRIINPDFTQKQRAFFEALAKLHEEFYRKFVTPILPEMEELQALMEELQALQAKKEQYEKGRLSLEEYLGYLISKLKSIGLKELKRLVPQIIREDIPPDEREEVIKQLISLLELIILKGVDPTELGLENLEDLLYQILDSAYNLLASEVGSRAEEKVGVDPGEILQDQWKIEDRLERHRRNPSLQSLIDLYSFMKSTFEKYGLDTDHFVKAYQEYAPLEEQSEELLKARDEGMFQHTIDAIEELTKRGDKGIKVAIRVGDAHVEGLTRRFREAGYSYYYYAPPEDIAYSPDEHRAYVEHLSGFASSLGELLKGRIAPRWRITEPWMQEQILTQVKIAWAVRAHFEEGKSPGTIEAEINGLNLPHPDRPPSVRVAKIHYSSMAKAGVSQHIYLTLELSDGGIGLAKVTPDGLFADVVRFRWDEKSLSRGEIEALLTLPENAIKRAKLTDALLTSSGTTLPDTLLNKGATGQPKSAAIVLEWQLAPVDGVHPRAYGIVVDGVLKAISKEQYMGEQPLDPQDALGLFSVLHRVSQEDSHESLMETYYRWYYDRLEDLQRDLKDLWEDLKDKDPEKAEKVKKRIQEVEERIHKVKARIREELRTLPLAPGAEVRLRGIRLDPNDPKSPIFPPTADGFVRLEVPEPLLMPEAEGSFVRLISPEAIVVDFAPSSVMGDLTWKLTQTIEMQKVIFLGADSEKSGTMVKDRISKIQGLAKENGVPIQFEAVTGRGPEEVFKLAQEKAGKEGGIVFAFAHIPEASRDKIEYRGRSNRDVIEKKDLGRGGKYEGIVVGKLIFGFLCCYAGHANFSSTVVTSGAILGFGPLGPIDPSKILDALEEIAQSNAFKKDKMSAQEFFQELWRILRKHDVEEEGSVIITAFKLDRIILRT